MISDGDARIDAQPRIHKIEEIIKFSLAELVHNKHCQHFIIAVAKDKRSVNYQGKFLKN